MIRNNIKKCLGIFMVAIITYGCNSFSVNDYKGLVKRELKKGKRVDSLFLGISFGMTSKTFYGHCRELNNTITVKQNYSL